MGMTSRREAKRIAHDAAGSDPADAEEAAGVDGRRRHDRQLRRAALRHRAVRLAVQPPPRRQRHPAAGDRRPVGHPLRAAAARQLGSPDRQHHPCAGPRLPDDARRDVAVHLRHGDRLDSRRLRHVADRQHRRALPVRRRALRDQPHRRVGPDLRLAGVPDRVRVLHPQGVGDRRRRDRAVRLRRRPARRAARHARGVLAGASVRSDRGRGRRVPAVRARAQGARAPKAQGGATHT